MAISGQHNLTGANLSVCVILTHLPLDQMADFSQTIFSDAFSWKKCFVFWAKFLKFVPKGPIDNNLTLV